MYQQWLYLRIIFSQKSLFCVVDTDVPLCLLYIYIFFYFLIISNY